MNSSECDFSPEENGNSLRPELGKVDPFTRQTLSTAQVFPLQKKQIIQTALLAPRHFLLVHP
jgi:hypothetical protein